MGQTLSHNLNCYAPQGTDPAKPDFISIEFEWQLNAPATMVAVVIDKWGQMADESKRINPLQQGNYNVFMEGSRALFRGKGWRVQRGQQGGRSIATIFAYDKGQVLNETKSLLDDADPVNPLWRDVWDQYSGPVSFSAVRFYPVFDYGSSSTGTPTKHRWQAKFDNAVYLSESYVTGTLALGTVLGEGMANSSSDIATLKLTASNEGMPPAGFFLVKTAGVFECCQYNGKLYDESLDVYTLLNIKRAMLGSVAALHNAADEVYPLIGKRLHWAAALKLEGADGTTYSSPAQIEDANYQPNFIDGSITFNTDPLTLRRKDTNTDFASIWGSGASVDEENTAGGQLLASTVFQGLMEADPTEGGPGWKSGYVDTCRPDISLSPDPVIARVECNGMSPAEFIRRFLAESGINRGIDNDLVGHAYDAETDKYVMRTLSQGAPVRRYSQESMIDKSVDIQDVYTMVSSLWGDGQKVNLLASPRMWHPPARNPSSGPPDEPYVFHLANGTWAQSGAGYSGGAVDINIPHAYQLTQIVTAADGAPNLLTDNDGSTGLAIGWQSSPGAGRYLYSWCPGASETAPDLHFVTDAIISLEVVGTVDAAAPFGIQVEGYTGFTHGGSSEPSVTGRSLLSLELVNTWQPGTASTRVYTLANKTPLNVLLKGIDLYFTGLLRDGAAPFSNRYTVKILDIALFGFRGSPARSRVIPGFDTSKLDGLTAPLTADKLIDIHMGQHKHKYLDNHGGTQEVERYYAWLELIQSLRQPEHRTYKVDMRVDANRQAGLAKVGEVLGFSDGYEGLCDNVRYKLPGSIMEARVINYRTQLTGAAI